MTGGAGTSVSTGYLPTGPPASIKPGSWTVGFATWFGGIPWTSRGCMFVRQLQVRLEDRSLRSNNWGTDPRGDHDQVVLAGRQGFCNAGLAAPAGFSHDLFMLT